MVTVYFSNGHKAEMRDAVKVAEKPLTTGASLGGAIAGIVCLDAEEKEVGHFKVSDISGYTIEK